LRSLQAYLLVNRRNKRQTHLSHSLRRRLGRGGFGCGSVAVILLAVSLFMLGTAYANLTSGMPSVAQLPVLLDPIQGSLMQPTRLYDRTGEKLLLVLENPGIPRRYLPLDPGYPQHISPYLVQVTLALYDPHFWSHPGFLWEDIYKPEPQTIPERLVDDLLLEDEAPGLRRALRMRLLSAQLISAYGRSQVLEWYFNSVYYGHLAYGVDSAARLYLGKSASQINLYEAALLAPIAEAPALNPLDTPGAALERQDAALNQLLAIGMINVDERIEAIKKPLELVQSVSDPAQIAPAFNRMVLEQLIARYGRSQVERGGLRVITSLDYELQLQFVCTAQAQLMRLNGEAGLPGLPGGRECDAAGLLPALPPGTSIIESPLIASGVLLDLENGQVLALLGDSSARDQSAELAGRQPGTLLSPFVAMAGFARGISPSTMVWDIPAAHGMDALPNSDGLYHGPQRLRIALANDYLQPISQLLSQIGSINVWRLIEPLGLSLDNPAQPEDLLIGGGSVSPLDLAQAYSVFARQGVQIGEQRGRDNRLRPVMLLRVEDPAGRAWLEEPLKEQQAVLSQPLAFLVHHVLSDDPARWPSLGYPNPLEIGRPAGAKIGRAGDSREVWAIGYTPQRLAVVWLGSSDEDLQLEPTMAASIWHAVMRYAVRDLPSSGWQTPAGINRITVCDPSGLLPSATCPTTVDEVFLSSSEPVEMDTLFQVVQINRETGRLATVFTPLEMIEQQTYMSVPPEAQSWAQSAGILQPPVDYDSLRAPQSSPLAQISAPDVFQSVNGMVIVRGTAAGEGFESYRLQVGEGLNPRSWLQIGEPVTRPVENGILGRWNTHGLDGLYALRLLVVYADRQVETAVIQVTVDNQPPQVQILYPEAGQVFSYPVKKNINLQVDVQENIEVSRVEWYIDGILTGKTRQAPHILSWSGTLGDHQVTVKAFDTAGNASEAGPVRFSLQYDSQP
jgi:membrane carboxypeptidase/penicillin-binding protein